MMEYFDLLCHLFISWASWGAFSVLSTTHTLPTLQNFRQCKYDTNPAYVLSSYKATCPSLTNIVFTCPILG